MYRRTDSSVKRNAAQGNLGRLFRASRDAALRFQRARQWGRAIAAAAQ
jgi:hypothetical protein